MKKEGKPKKEKGEQVQPEEGPAPSFAPPPPPAEETGPPPPPPPAGEEAPEVEKEGQPKPKKGEAPGTPCPEGMVPLEDGSCVTPQ